MSYSNVVITPEIDVAANLIFYLAIMLWQCQPRRRCASWEYTSTNTSQHDSIRVNTNQHESTQVHHESTRVNTSLTRVNTNLTQVWHESTQVNTSPTQINTNQHESKTSQHEYDTSQHGSTRVKKCPRWTNMSQNKSIRV